MYLFKLYITTPSLNDINCLFEKFITLSEVRIEQYIAYLKHPFEISPRLPVGSAGDSQIRTDLISEIL